MPGLRSGGVPGSRPARPMPVRRPEHRSVRPARALRIAERRHFRGPRSLLRRTSGRARSQGRMRVELAVPVRAAGRCPSPARRSRCPGSTKPSPRSPAS
jgi:hypothetical protein